MDALARKAASKWQLKKTRAHTEASGPSAPTALRGARPLGSVRAGSQM
jgi:hypothetical protein